MKTEFKLPWRSAVPSPQQYAMWQRRHPFVINCNGKAVISLSSCRGLSAQEKIEYAELICRAVNAHEALVEALDRLLAPNGKSNTVAHIYQTLVDRDQDAIDEEEADFMQAVEQAKAALTQATTKEAGRE